MVNAPVRRRDDSCESVPADPRRCSPGNASSPDERSPVSGSDGPSRDELGTGCVVDEVVEVDGRVVTVEAGRLVVAVVGVVEG